MSNWLSKQLDKLQGTVWADDDSKRITFTRQSAQLVTPSSLTVTQQILHDRDTGKRMLSDEFDVMMMSIEIKAFDHVERKAVKTWIRGQALRRLIERPKPTRKGFSHDRYSVMINYLMYERLIEQEGIRNSFIWTSEYQRLSTRAEWLISMMKAKGQYRRIPTIKRYDIAD